MKKTYNQITAMYDYDLLSSMAYCTTSMAKYMATLSASEEMVDEYEGVPYARELDDVVYDSVHRVESQACIAYDDLVGFITMGSYHWAHLVKHVARQVPYVDGFPKMEYAQYTDAERFLAVRAVFEEDALGEAVRVTSDMSLLEENADRFDDDPDGAIQSELIRMDKFSRRRFGIPLYALATYTAKGDTEEGLFRILDHIEEKFNQF